MRDIKHDKKAGIKTLSISIGYKKAQKVYSSSIILSYISLILMIIFRYIPYLSSICLFTIPTAIKNINKLRIAKDSNNHIAELDKESGKL
ncbi:MAG: hypothetical protein ABF685_16985 [Clostridium saccharoperbutylacetonicum]